MPVKDVFEYNDRWDSVGLRCGNCVYKKEPKEWPDVNKEYGCAKYNLSFATLLRDSGYVEGEWFCRSFENNGTANKGAYEIFCKIRDQLKDDILYGFYGGNGYLKEINFSDLR
jgi:hypothetical protein